MNSIATGALVFDLVKLVLYVACGYLAFSAYVRYAKTPWLMAIATRRFAVWTLLSLLVVGIKVFEDVIAKESGPVDTALLLLIRDTTPPALVRFFSVVTLGGAAKFLVPGTAVVCMYLLITRHQREAVFLALSMGCGWLLTYTIKSLVGRPRPELWSTAWYWGSSFPSGHTVSTAVFATAIALCAARIWPTARYLALGIAVVWIGLMGMSRLVLGVHWPSDVLAAVCVGVFLPLAISLLVLKDDSQTTFRAVAGTKRLDKLVE